MKTLRTWIRDGLSGLTRHLLLQRWSRETPESEAKARHSLIIELGGLGDSLYLLDFIAQLKRDRPDEEVHVICRDYVRSFFDLAPGIDRVHGIRKNILDVRRLSGSLITQPYRSLHVTVWSLYANLLLHRLSKPRHFLGYLQAHTLNSHAPGTVDTRRIPAGTHLSQIRRLATSPDLCFNREVSPGYMTDAEPEGCSLMLFSDDAGKSLGFSEALRLLQGISRHLPRPIRLIGGPKEIATIKKLCSSPLGRELDIVPYPCHDWSHTIALLRKSRVVISVDTGVMHLCAALDIPVHALFKSTNPRLCGALPRNAPVSNYAHPGEIPELVKNLGKIFPDSLRSHASGA